MMTGVAARHHADCTKRAICRAACTAIAISQIHDSDTPAGNPRRKQQRQRGQQQCQAKGHPPDASSREQVQQRMKKLVKPVQRYVLRHKAKIGGRQTGHRQQERQQYQHNQAGPKQFSRGPQAGLRYPLQMYPHGCKRQQGNAYVYKHHQ